MSITSVFPPSSTPGGWFGCFGPPSIVAPGSPPIAWPVSGQVPCGNGTVESCCILGDRCLSNGVCQIMPIANGGGSPLYYGAYCTDPTFSSPECTKNCAVKYMAYCVNNVWQCGNTDRTHPIACNFSGTTTSDSSTFFMIEPTKLATVTLLPSNMPTTTDVQYIPIQWGVPSARSSDAKLVTSSASTITPSMTTSTTTTSTSSQTPTPSSSENTKGKMSQSELIAAICTPLGVFVAILGILAFLWSQEAIKILTCVFCCR